jgi:chitin-binding protein
MTAYRTLSSLAAASLTALLVAGWSPGPARAAHGATGDPLSRSAACAPINPSTARSAACRAAVSAGGGRGFADWDNVRVSGVNGRDRQRIPDGRLCSGGLPEFRGLDLARADWPVTSLPTGRPFTFRYQSTIPHRGTFRVYVTRNGYDPTRPLRWSDLEARPFLTVTDPPLIDNTYRFSGRLPSGKAGRHLLYVVWRNSDTPDTYYSCSDVFFRGANRLSRTASPSSPAAAPAPTAPESAAAPAEPTAPARDAGVGAAPRPAGASSAYSSALAGVGLAVLAGAALVAGLALARRRRY